MTSMRDLWDEHVQYTRMVLTAFVFRLPSLPDLEQRLLENQDALGEAFGAVFGAAFGHELAVLLREHISGAAEFLAAIRSRDVSASTQKKAAWYANGERIATLLASTGRWPREALSAAMREHLDTTTTEVFAEFAGYWEASVAAYDVARRHVLEMADVLEKGLH